MTESKTSNSKIDAIGTRVGRIEVRLDEVLIPQVKDIKDTLERGNFASKADLEKVASDVEALQKVTRNTPTIEKAVFTMIGVVLLAVLSAGVGLVVYTGVNR